MLKIANQTLQYGLALAPMAGVTDRAFREVCRDLGAEYLVSEMVSAKALVYEQKCRRGITPNRVRTAGLAEIADDELPMAIQLFGAEPEFMAEAASLLESGDYLGKQNKIIPTAIDVNMGCPMAKIVSNGEGADLLRHPERAEAVVSAMAKRVSLPITVKMRIGWDDGTIVGPEFARRMQDAGASAITVHGRTKAQLYAPSARWNEIEKVKRAVSIPVFGNGDVFSGEDALRMIRETGVDGIAVGRGAQGNPWIFDEIRHALDGTPYQKPTLAERMAVAKAHAEKLVAYKGEKVGIAEARKHMAWYIYGEEGSAALRHQIMMTETKDELLALLDAFARHAD